MQRNISFKFVENNVLKQHLENAERYLRIFTINKDTGDSRYRLGIEANYY